MDGEQRAEPRWAAGVDWLAAIVFALVFGRGLLGADAAGLGDWDYFLSHAFAAHRSWFEFGQAAAWSPWHCGGEALYENFQARVYSPSFLLVAILGPDLGLRVTMMLMLALGFEGARRCARSMGATPWAARLAAVVVAGNGAVLANVAIGHFGSTPYVLIAWVLWALSLGDTRPRAAAVYAGAWLSLMWLEGAIYPLVHGLLLCGVWLLVRAIRRRSPRPLLVGLGALGSFLLMAGFSLLPAAAHLLRGGRTDVEPESVPLSAIGGLLLSPDLRLRAPPRFEGQVWGYHEYAAYVGPVVLVLALYALSRVRRVPATAGWLLAVVPFLLWVLGDDAPIPLFRTLHALPVFGSMRASGRAMFMVVFCLAMAIALSLRHRGFARALTLLVAAELAWVTPQVVAPMFALRYEIQHSSTFTQRDDHQTLTLGNGVNYSFMTQALRSEQGMIACYDPAAPARNARQRWPDREEQWLLPARGEVTLERFSPNELVYHVSGARAGALLVVNQNYHPGWTHDGAPAKARSGLLAAALRGGDERVVLRFEPALFQLGFALSLCLALGLAALAYRERRGPGPTPKPRDADPADGADAPA